MLTSTACGRKNKKTKTKNLSEKVKKKILNSTTKLKKLTRIAKKQKLCQKKVKFFEVNGHHAVPLTRNLFFFFFFLNATQYHFLSLYFEITINLLDTTLIAIKLICLTN